jgi:uncharacterized protein YecE (DUF72 family)
VAQLDLFADDDVDVPLAFTEERQLASRLPQEILFGTSSWTFPGWAGSVYPGKPDVKALLERGLPNYVKNPLFRTVGVDRFYYAPPAPGELEAYAAQLPAGYPCVLKAWAGVTTTYDARTLRPNKDFLDPALLTRAMVDPLRRAFREHTGALLLEIPPTPASLVLDPSRLVDQLDRFFQNLSREIRYAVELRDSRLLTPDYLAMLAHHGVSHAFNHWERMPTVGAQLQLPGSITAPFVVARLMIRPGARYEDLKARFAPFDRLQEPDPAMREDAVRLAHRCVEEGRPLFLLVGNKAEGSSPPTIKALAGMLARS